MKCTKKSWTERWNNFAKKKIYINSHFQVSMGRLIYTIGLITISSIGVLLTGAPISAIFPGWLTAFTALEKQCEEEEGDDSCKNQE